MTSEQMNISLYKRKEFQDITNTYNNSKRSNIHTLLPSADDVKMTVTEQQQIVNSIQKLNIIR